MRIHDRPALFHILLYILLAGPTWAQDRKVDGADLTAAVAMARTDSLLCVQPPGRPVVRCPVTGVLGLIGPGDLPATFAALTLPATGQFYADQGAKVGRVGDRLLVGAAADNPGAANRDVAPRDWLSNVMGGTSIGAWPVWGAQGASLARYGNIGFLGGSRTSDARVNAGLLGYVPSSIGVAAWAVSDDTAAPTSTTGYAFYGEAWRLPGASYQPVFGLELEGVNFGGVAVGQTTPYHVNIGGGVYGAQLGCGGGQTAGVSDCAGVLNVVANGARSLTGINFGAAALTGTDGTAADAGYASAVTMGRNQAVQWYAPDGGVGAFHRSTVTASAHQTRLEHQDSGVVISNAAGQQLFAVGTVGTATNSLYTQAGTGTQAAGMYTAAGAGGSANLGLYPAAGGEIQTQGPVTATGAVPSGSPAYGWLHINVNGVDARVPLYSPAQAGG